MKIYISYKSRNNPDKKKLKADLMKISNTLEDLGHKTFILERDIKGWKTKHSPVHTNFWPIIKNIFKSDLIFAYITNDNQSKGLFFETVMANLLGKKDILAIRKGIKADFYRKNIKKIIEFETFDNLLKKLPKELSEI